MINITLSFNTTEEALAALKKLEGTAADPAVGKPTPVKGAAAATPSTAAKDAAPEKKEEPSGRPLDFKDDLVTPFIALAKLEDGTGRQREVIKHFGISRLSELKPEQYAEALEQIKARAQ